MNNGYNPSKRVAKILEFAMKTIKSVPYKTSSRWVFYQIYQNLGIPKKNVKLFDKWTSRARKNFWNGWKPDTMYDSIREMTIRGMGYDSPEEWFETFKEKTCLLDKIRHQKYYMMMWFEARAMQDQFKHYTRNRYISLVPFGGDASIPYKWKIAKHLEEMFDIYGKPIVILYFGDFDDKGMLIPESAIKDIRKWCKLEFIREGLPKPGQVLYHRVGLNEEHIEQFKIPDSPEEPGKYQWEALNDRNARHLILSTLRKFWSDGVIRKIEEEESEATEFWKSKISELSWGDE